MSMSKMNAHLGRGLNFRIGWVDWVVFFEELMPLKCRMLGEEMATILMIAVGPVTVVKPNH